MLLTFLCVDWWFVYLFWRHIYSSSLPVFILICLFIIESEGIFIHSKYQSINNYMACKYFFSFYTLSFGSLDRVLYIQKFYIFMKFIVCTFPLKLLLLLLFFLRSCCPICIQRFTSLSSKSLWCSVSYFHPSLILVFDPLWAIGWV